MKKTCFYDVSLEAGAKMVEMFGYYLPWEYSMGGEEEHIGIRTRVSLCDLDYMAQFKITGPEAEKFLMMLLTTDVSTSKLGQIKYTAICDENGLMQDDGTIWKFRDQSFVLITGDEGDYDWVASHAEGYNVKVENITWSWTTLALQGPKATAVLEKLVDINAAELKYYNFVETQLNGKYCIVDRMGYTGSGGFEFHFDNQYAREFWNLIMDAGREFDIVPCGQMALESLRQEAGYLLVGNDHDKTRNPIEAGIGFTVKFQKENFIGKDALLKIAKEGTDKRLVWFKLKDGQVAKTGDAILLDGEQIGTVTSGSYSPTAKQGTAMGYVKVGCANPSFPYEIVIDGRPARAIMSLVPLFDPDDKTTRGGSTGFSAEDILNGLGMTAVACDKSFKIAYHNAAAGDFFKLLFNKDTVTGGGLELCHNEHQIANIKRLFKEFQEGKKLNFFMMPDDKIEGGLVKVVHVPIYKDGEVAGILEFDFESSLEPGGIGEMTYHNNWR